MICVACGKKSTVTTRTLPAWKRQDKRNYRTRKCSDCDTTFSTIEVRRDELVDLELTAEAAQVMEEHESIRDLNHELEKLLRPAMTVMEAALIQEAPNKTLTDLAWKVLMERQEYRNQLTQGVDPISDEHKELAAILALVPDEVSNG